MMEVRRYRASDHDAVWELHNVALNDVGAHAGSGLWDDDLHRIEVEYIEAGGEVLSRVASSRWAGSSGSRTPAPRYAECGYIPTSSAEV